MSTIHTWHVTLNVYDTEDGTTVHAVLTTDDGTVEGHGRAHRNPHDVDVPEIGAEIAAARALNDVGAELLRLASGDIEALQHGDVHLLQ
ncbi:MAG TPA: DUF1876 domain-containing protein [Actinomycetales bacterium]|nr:DUF1876 domain-containing protein [Actinomycetales bacterium]